MNYLEKLFEKIKKELNPEYLYEFEGIPIGASVEDRHTAICQFLFYVIKNDIWIEWDIEPEIWKKKDVNKPVRLNKLQLEKMIKEHIINSKINE